MPEITPINTEDDAVYNLNYAVGEQNASLSVMPMKGVAADNLAAAKAVANLIFDHVDGALGSITARQEYYPNLVPQDSAARIQPARFNMILNKSGVVSRETIFVPWFKGADQASKTTLGIALAAALSGPEGTYTFRS